MVLLHLILVAAVFYYSAADDLIPVRRELYGGGRIIIDITGRYDGEMPSWDGIGSFVVVAQSTTNGSYSSNFSEMKFAHSATHVGAPGHVSDRFFAGFDHIHSLDLDVLNGPALVVDVPRDKNITAEVIKSLNIPNEVKRLLFRTLNTDRGLMLKKEFDTSFVGFEEDGAQWLVDNTDIKLVGTDYLYDEGTPAHLVFHAANDITLVEGLKLDGVRPGLYSVHCLPLRLVGAEGSPIRCILIK